MAAHRDDPLGAEFPGGHDGEQPDRAVPDDGDGLPRSGLGGDGAEPAGAEHVGGGQQAGDQVVGRDLGGGDQGAVGQRDPQRTRLGRRIDDEFPVHAERSDTRPGRSWQVLSEAKNEPMTNWPGATA